MLRLPPFEYLAPQTLDEAVALLDQHGPEAMLVAGGTDLYPSASLAWNNGNHNWMSYITGDIPVGTYDPTALSNLEIGALSNEV